MKAQRYSAIVVSVLLLVVSRGGAQNKSVEQIRFYESDVQPILERHCLKCHGGADKIRGGLQLTSRSSILKGGDTGPAISLDEPSESLLIDAINYESFEMPPDGKLPQAKIDVLTRWVMMGAPMPASNGAPAAATERMNVVNERTRQFWSFRPVTKPVVPKVQDASWVKTPIDAFIAKRLETVELAPSPAAAKTSLLRRAFYNLTGLPPEPADVKAFLADTSPRAFEKVVDRLLRSPQYGEHWARHWLDVVRYAETNSYERDGIKPFVWRYRDYVIRSFNDDKPYDQFILEQLAGDELDEVTPESIIATGYYRLGIWDDEPTDRELAFYDDSDDILRTTAEGMLGITVGCARCHDHKIDPVPQEDYYRMLAFFRNVRRFGVRAEETVIDASVRTIALQAEQRRHAKAVKAHKNKMEETQRKLNAIEKLVTLVGVEKDEFQNEAARVGILKGKVPEQISPEQFDEYVVLTRRRAELRKSPPPGLAQALCVKEHGPTAPETHVLIRGSSKNKGDVVQPGFPSVLSPPEPNITAPDADADSCGRRLALARWIASDRNPLTARVIVNRIWQHHFGRGIVRSPNDFGTQGAKPTHPELLDWLADNFVENGWRFKRIHKLIMMSAAYQMSSQANESAWSKDPENDFFWRFDMRRLSAEEVRDSILAVNGSLNRAKMYGPSIYTIIPAEVLAGQSRPGHGWGKSSAEDRNRRSIYIHIKRSLITPILASFDAADTDLSCPERFVTTQPTQALGMLNSDFINREATVFADYLGKHADETPKQVALALMRVLQRSPMQDEIDRGVNLIRKLERQGAGDRAMQQFCVVALNLNEFMYLD